MSTVPVVPVYFELSWSILSTIGCANVLFSILVVGITTLSPVAAVPIVTSTACAVANGLCYYAFYEFNDVQSQAIASGFADLMWMVAPLPPLPEQNQTLTIAYRRRSRRPGSHSIATSSLAEYFAASNGISSRGYFGP